MSPADEPNATAEPLPPEAGTELTRAPLFLGMVRFGSPLVVAMGLGAVFNLVDLWVVARLPDSGSAVAAVGIPSLVNTIPNIIFNGIVSAMIAIVARQWSMGGRARASVTAGQTFLLTILLSVVFGVPPWLFAEEICVALGAQGAVVAPATEFLEIMSLGTFTMFVLMYVTGVMRAIGNSRVPVVLMVGANVLNVLLDFWFVFGGFGLKPMGVAGAAWATVISRLFFCVIGLMMLYVGMKGLRLRRFTWNSAITANILRIGIPSCLQWVVRMASYLYVMHFVAEAARRAGEGVTEAQAAYSVGMRLDSLALFSGIGWGAAAATFVGQNLGRGLRERAVQAAWIALGLNMAMMLLFAAAYALFPDVLLRLMGFDVTGDAEAVRRIGRTYLYVASSGFVYLAVAVVVSQALAGAGATKFPLLVDTIGYGLIGFPLTWWAAQRAGEWGMRGLWLASIWLHLAVAVAYLIWFRFGSWAKKELR